MAEAAAAQPSSPTSEDDNASFEASKESIVENIMGKSVNGVPDSAHNSQMLAVKDERKRAEYDVQLLANRLAYLRAEERAANKKVADTKKRTQDIAAAKKHAADKEKMRDEWRASLKNKEAEQREYYRKDRETRRQNRNGAAGALLQQKKGMAEKAKQEQGLLNLQKNNMTSGEHGRRLASHANIRQTHLQQKAKEAKRAHDHQLHLDKAHRRKVEEERRRKEDAEALIAQFEAEEARLISRLKQSQLEQHGALTELEKTLLSSAHK